MENYTKSREVALRMLGMFRPMPHGCGPVPVRMAASNERFTVLRLDIKGHWTIPGLVGDKWPDRPGAELVALLVAVGVLTQRQGWALTEGDET